VIDYYSRIAPVMLPHLRRQAGHAAALAGRHRRGALLREGPRSRRARLDAATRDRPFRRSEGLPAGRRRRRTRLPRAGREPRTPHAAVALRPRRARIPRPPRARPRPGPRRRARRMRGGGTTGPRHPVGHGHGAVAGDERIQGHPPVRLAGHDSIQRRDLGVRPRTGTRPGSRRSRSRRERDEQGRPSRQGVRRLEQNNAAKTTIAPYSLRGAPSRRSPPPHLGRARRPRPAPPAVRRGARARRRRRRPARPLAPAAPDPLAAYVAKRTPSATPEPFPPSRHSSAEPPRSGAPNHGGSRDHGGS
jgi:hypothetical protein